MKSYKMTIAGLQRELPLFPISDRLSIAAFIMFGDVEITIAAADALLQRVGKDAFDIIVTPEAKSIPLAYEMARQSGKSYVVARKSTKVYMKNPIEVRVNSITTEQQQRLYLAEDDAVALRGRRVLVVDDVISTGSSLDSLCALVSTAGGKIAACCSVLAEGDAAKREDIIFLEPLPLFEN